MHDMLSGGKDYKTVKTQKSSVYTKMITRKIKREYTTSIFLLLLFIFQMYQECVAIVVK